MASQPGTVLITGASSGIGAATAERLLQCGWTVIAAARRPETMAQLAGRGAITLLREISDAASRRSLADRIDEQFDALDAPINNAGYAKVGPLETKDLQRARALFEVNISSIAGRWVSPSSGWYAAR